MLTKIIKDKMKISMIEVLGEGLYEEYANLENNDLDQAITNMQRYSHGGFRDGEQIVVTKNAEYQREVVEVEDGHRFYGTNLYDTWIIQDADDNTYYISLISDSVEFEEEVEQK